MNYRKLSAKLMPIVDEAFKNLKVLEAQKTARLAPRHGYGPGVGDIYVFSPAEKEGVMVFWIIVHRVDLTTFTIIPLDDSPFLGSGDVDVKLLDLKARCGRGLFLSYEYLNTQTRVDFVPDEVPPLKQELAALARGSTQSTHDQVCTNADPEYESWMDDLSYVVERITLRDQLLFHQQESERFRELARATQSPFEYSSWMIKSDVHFFKAQKIQAILNKK